MAFRKTIESATAVDAPAEQVWQVITDLPRYRDWNRATRFNTAPTVGKMQLMMVKLGFLWLPVPVLIQHCDAQQGLRWIGGIPGLITGSHYFRAEPVDDQHTRLVQGEDFYGLLVPVLLPLLGSILGTLYATINADTKAWCERQNP